jgi:hypothetical protein
MKKEKSCFDCMSKKKKRNLSQLAYLKASIHYTYMKKILVILCVLWSGGHALAQDLTVGDTLVIYFNELFPIVYLSHSEVTLKYTDLGNKP